MAKTSVSWIPANYTPAGGIITSCFVTITITFFESLAPRRTRGGAASLTPKMLYLVNQVLAQTPGALKKESHPKLSVASCTKSGGCKDEQKMVTIDSNWRWTHENGVAKNCYTGNKWDDTLCPDPDTCTKNCVIEGADAEYESTYGVIAQGADLRLNFVTQGPSSKNVGSRTYLLDVSCPAR